MLKEVVLHNFNNAGCSPQFVQVKVNNERILLSNLNKAVSLTNNRCVHVLTITRYVFKVQTIGEN